MFLSITKVTYKQELIMFIDNLTLLLTEDYEKVSNIVKYLVTIIEQRIKLKNGEIKLYTVCDN